VELYYFDGCPSYAKALDNLIHALALEKLPADVEIVRVRGAADAEAKRCIGSPTIRINGVDLDGAEAEALGYSHSCRIYQEGGQRAGWPSVGRIRQAIQRARAAS
jgi:hypothetical protein